MPIRMCVLSLTYLTYQNTCNVINNIIEWVFLFFYLMSLGYMFQERNAMSVQVNTALLFGNSTPCGIWLDSIAVNCSEIVLDMIIVMAIYDH